MHEWTIGLVQSYFAGHGERFRRGSRGRGQLYARPEPDASESGYDGVIDSRLIALEVLEPPATHADVHLIADACRSYYLLARGVAKATTVKRPLPDLDLESAFTDEFPTVGAVLATNSTAAGTWQNETVGGIFSHAIRTGAIGEADFDRDGIITYGELNRLLVWILAASRETGINPTVVPPGSVSQTPFVDWRGTSAGQVCLPPSMVGRRTLNSRRHLRDPSSSARRGTDLARGRRRKDEAQHQ